MLQEIEAKIKDLTSKLEQSLANHNFMAGALNELKSIKNLYEKAETALPLIESAIPVIEEVAKSVEAVIPAVEAIAQVL